MFVFMGLPRWSMLVLRSAFAVAGWDGVCVPLPAWGGITGCVCSQGSFSSPWWVRVPPSAAMHLFFPVEDDAKSESYEDELSEEDNEDTDGAS